ALVGAAAVLVIAVAVAWHPWNEAPAPVAAVELEQLVDSPVTASVTLEAVAWGTRVSLECRYDGALASVPDDPYGRSGRVYALVVRDVAGNAEQVATWSAVAGTMTVPGATAIPRDQIVEVDLVGADGTALLRAEV
ncbi:MAG: hypothetical protein HGA44_15360, partial [Cellulomonadaceae bacterium]|nr:hypothetical protein [Cellulomonadaceae bacterium]